MSSGICRLVPTVDHEPCPCAVRRTKCFSLSFPHDGSAFKRCRRRPNDGHEILESHACFHLSLRAPKAPGMRCLVSLCHAVMPRLRRGWKRHWVESLGRHLGARAHDDKPKLSFILRLHGIFCLQASRFIVSCACRRLEKIPDEGEFSLRIDL